MMNTPFVMVYRVSLLTYLLGKPRVKVPRFAMVNLIAGEEVVPELVQHDFTAEKVVARLKEILADGPARDRMIEGLARVKARLRAPGAGSGPVPHPADRAADIILALAPSVLDAGWAPSGSESRPDAAPATNSALAGANNLCSNHLLRQNPHHRKWVIISWRLS